jgi:hypothetical protein
VRSKSTAQNPRESIILVDLGNFGLTETQKRLFRLSGGQIKIGPLLVLGSMLGIVRDGGPMKA